MLAQKSYPKTYVDDCRARVASQVSAYRCSGTTDAALAAAFFNNMVITLDGYFMHRMRGQEGKDGNPINEVRALATSMLQNGDRLQPDPTFKLDPSRSVLGLADGDPIALDEGSFVRLAEAYFAEVEKRFPG